MRTSFFSSTGITEKQIDSVRIFLTYRTAQKTGVCKAALKHWRDKYNKAALEVTSEIITDFKRQPDLEFEEKINVEAWVCELNNYLEHSISMYSPTEWNNFISRMSSTKIARFLKTILLIKYAREFYDALVNQNGKQ